MALRPVFVYGTLRAGSWNHKEWLAPWLAGPTEPATLVDHALHHHDGLPYVVAAPGASTKGELARLDPDRYAAGLARLDVLEATAERHYDRAEVMVAGEPAYVYVAGPRVAAALSAATAVPGGDWLRR